MNTYIAIQLKVDEIKDGGKNITLSNILRVIKAETKEEAIGKFVVDTRDTKALQKLEIDCYDINEFSIL